MACGCCPPMGSAICLALGRIVCHDIEGRLGGIHLCQANSRVSVLTGLHAEVVARLDRRIIDQDVTVSCSGAARLVVRFRTSEEEDSRAVSEPYRSAVVPKVLISQVA